MQYKSYLKHKAVLTLILLLCMTCLLHAQKIKCEVIIHTDHLPLEEQTYLQGLDLELRQILNEYHWTDGSYSYELPIRVEIFFEKYSLLGAWRKYEAGMMVAMKQGMQLRDKRWEFKINRDIRMHIGEPYDTFTGLIEFYVMMCLGYEVDRFGPLNGQPFFERAREIAEKSRFENKYYKGWDQRRELVDDFTQKDSYKNFRAAAFYVNAGLYYFDKGDLEAARGYLKRGAENAMKGKPGMLELHRDGHIIRFIDISRLVATLKELEEFNTLDEFAEWDSENSEIYR